MKISNLKPQISNYIKHPLFAGSMVMVIGSNLSNLGQFIYHFLTGRILGKVYYGDVAAIISILGLVAIVQMSLSLTIVKFVATGKTESSISNLAKWLNWWTIWIGLIVGMVVFAASPYFAKFLNIQDQRAVYILGPLIFLSVIVNTGRSILQGLLAFQRYVTSLLVEAGVKIILTIVFVLLGFAVLGAVGGIFVGTLSAFFVTRISLVKYLSGKREGKPNIASLLRYSFPVFVQGLALTSMYSTDLILVKHFFSPSEAGIYASLAVLGRIAFFGASPVSQVMFPLVAKRHSDGEAYHKIFYLSIVLVLIAALVVIVFYLFFPGVAIGILYGQEFIKGSPMLWWFGIFMGFLVLSNHLTQFYLSVGKTKIVALFAIAAVLQIILIWLVHPNLLTVIRLSILSAALLLLSLLVYFPYHHRK